MRDELTDQPLLYLSCDAHAERVYDGQMWSTVYKMFNGIRVWCVDQSTRRTIPLGGEFLSGDCHAVSAAFADLIGRGTVPADGDYGDGVVAKLVFVADGMPWFDDYVLPHFPGMDVVLDAYHVLEKLAETVAILFGAGTAKAKRWYNRLCRLVTGRAPRSHKPRLRAGTPKRHNPTAPYDKRRRFPTYDPEALVAMHLPEHSGGALLAALAEIDVGENRKAKAALRKLVSYLDARKERIAYDEFWHRGFLISSAPMESFHRIAQKRLKLPGATWTIEMAQAVLNLRMMSVIGNDDRFWDDSEMRARVAHAFMPGGAP